MIAVKATREGLPGGKTSSGYRVEQNVPFVALPSTAALRQWVIVRNPRTTREVKAIVLDVGPWNEKDHAYVFQPSTMGENPLAARSGTIRPQAESGIDSFGRTTNGAGIDLGEYVWQALGMRDNEMVEWAFA